MMSTIVVVGQGFPMLQNRTQTGESQLQSSLKGGWHHWFCQDGSDAQSRYGIV